MDGTIAGNPLLRTIGAATVGLLVAVVLGAQIGEGSLVLPLVFASLLVVGSLYLIFFRATRIEALAVGFLIIGYIVGNRGFAQISLLARMPLFLGEVALALCAVLILARMTLQRERLLPNTPLGCIVFAYLGVGAIRLFLDVVVRVNHADVMTAVRDSATVDYAFFFLVAYRLGSMPRARRVLERCLVAAFLILPVVVLVSIFIPDKLMSIRLRGYPVIFHKYDLTTAYLSFASIYFFLAALDGKRRMIRLVLSVAYLCLMLMIVTRAAIFGFGCATLLLIAARQFRFLFVQALMVLIAATTIATLQVTNTGGQSFLAPLADKVESMTDFSGQGRSYRGEFGEVAADNNQFRLVWWRAVIDETVAKGPIFGLGFGYDLASNFVREYYGTYYRDFETRSPHSIWVTIFGRMGLIGLLVFIAFAFIFVRD
ncbi:MAG TPA: O-antigen ligase family protein, partial [Chthoniobacterales bacterium]